MDQGLAVDIAWVGGLLDAYAAEASMRTVAAEHPADSGAPPAMQAGPIDKDGWVEWRVLPSTLTEEDVDALEAGFGVRFPRVFRAYLLARLQLFDQVLSRRHGAEPAVQQVLMTHVPSTDPLGALRSRLQGWKPLIGAGFIPFAEWGDGWGPICFDSNRRAAGDDDCPLVWLDHEVLHDLEPEQLGDRAALLPLVQPLHGSCRDFLADVFSPMRRGR